MLLLKELFDVAIMCSVPIFATLALCFKLQGDGVPPQLIAIFVVPVFVLLFIGFWLFFAAISVRPR